MKGAVKIGDTIICECYARDGSLHTLRSKVVDSFVDTRLWGRRWLFVRNTLGFWRVRADLAVKAPRK